MTTSLLPKNVLINQADESRFFYACFHLNPPLFGNVCRMATPIECERLQTLPYNYSAGISNTQRYKCLGNGWTVDVIAHILKSISR